jgi:hypothetical protein
MRKPEHTMPVGLGIRSEHIIAVPDGAHDVAVEMTEPMGNDPLAWTRLDERSLSIRLPAETRLTIGDRPRFLLPEQRPFEANTGARQ